MYAVVETGGMQFRAEKAGTFLVPKIDGDVGSEVELSNVLLVSDGEAVTVGRPHVEGARVMATIVAHGKADKIIVFKLKRRKGYRRKRGHRQPYTELRVTEIVWPGVGTRTGRDESKNEGKEEEG